MTDSDAFAAIFKAYDIRGTVPDQLDARKAFAIGAGFARFAREAEGASSVLLAHDMRSSAASLAAAVTAGVRSVGCEVIELGLASTDLLYFASGRLASPGVMLTASHNPAAYNGLKLCLSGAKPIGEESGLVQIRALAEAAYDAAPSDPDEIGRLAEGAERRDLTEDFAIHVRSFVDGAAMAPLTVVADTANGMGGLIAPRVFAGLPMDLEVLYGELDGTFPNHPANPIEPENLVDLERLLLERHADVGLAFDGDADRVFLVDDLGVPLSGSTTTAIVAEAMLVKHPGATVLYNCICSKAVREIVEEHGGTAVRTRVGHSFIKQVMAETGAVFGGEHSGHYYFADNYRADSGIIASLVVLEVISKAGVPLSKLRVPYERYAGSGEINTEVRDPHTVIAVVREHYRGLGAAIDEIDGLTADLGDWWFNLRPSNTEPLLRLNVEAADAPEVARRVAEVKDAIAGASS